MRNYKREDAFSALWVITWLNIGGGALLWVINWFREIGAEQDLERASRNSNRSDAENFEILVSAAAWQATATNFIAFGILVLVITLAAVAVAGNQKNESSS